ncbi:MAG: hypothetical protein ACI8UO_000583 [Verrucomicrobiales bacterium]|jgi:hypothetical protein
MNARPLLLLGFTLALAAAHPDTEPKSEVDSNLQATPSGAKLSVQLTDAETGEPISGCIRIRSGKAEEWLDLSQQLLARGERLPQKIRALGWHTLIAETDLDVPPGPLRIEAFGGLEFDHSTLEVEEETARVEIPLARLFPASSQKWVAGNTHLHLRQMTREQADRYLLDISRADDLEVVFVSYLERALVDRDYTTNTYTKEDLKRISTPTLIFGDGEEYRHNFGGGGEGYGHVMFLNLAERILPASVGPGITKGGTDGTALQPGIEKARADGATVIWCHNLFGMEDLPNWIKGNIHAQNIFDGGNRGTYADTFYRYLNIGLKAPFSTGTDWFTYDFSRAYVKANDLSVESWLKALREGRSIITNGPWIELEVNSQSPGDVIDLKKPGEVEITARAVGRHDFGALEIVVGGRVLKSAPAEARKAGGFEASIDGFQQLLNEPAWIAARIQPDAEIRNEMDQPLFAHTSPVYVQMNGAGVFDPAVAAEIRAEIEESRNRISENGTFADDEDRQRVLQVYTEALQTLDNR